MGTCQSCGRDGEEVAAVQRVYLLAPDDTPIERPDRIASEGSPHVEDEVEYWCFTCRETFPHVPVG